MKVLYHGEAIPGIFLPFVRLIVTFLFFKVLYLIECNWRYESFYVLYISFLLDISRRHVIINNIDWKRFVEDSRNL